MTKQQKSVLFLGKADDSHVDRAAAFCQLNFTDVDTYVGKWGDTLPEAAKAWEGDYIISYLSRWVVPAYLLKKARIAAINFHPAPPEYPGIGATNFALYDESPEYGVTCHHMEPSVDTGDIIAVKRFPLFDSDSVSTLLSRTYDYQMLLFYEVISSILLGDKLPSCEATWTRKPFKRTEFDQLRYISPDMTAAEINRRIRATNFGIWKPMIKVKDFVFELKQEN